MRKDDWYFREDEEDRFGDAMHHRTEELFKVPNTVPDEDGFIECPVLPLQELVVLPHMVSPLFLTRNSAIMAIEAAQLSNQTVIALNQDDPELDEPGEGDFYSIGVEMSVGRLLNMPDNSSSALVQGRRRVEVVGFVQHEPFLIARARSVTYSVEVDRQTDATMRTALEMFHNCVQFDRSLPEDAYFYALNIDDPGWLSDMIITAIAPPIKTRLEILDILDPIERLKRVISILVKEADVLELEDEIHMRAQNEVNRTQREYYLREQMKVIQTELGEGDPWMIELTELRTRIESAGLPEEVLVRALKEVDRLGQMPPISSEVGIICTYIEWILELPWMDLTDDNLDIGHALNILERDHFGLPKAKERILEYIAVQSLKPKSTRQPILCFVGPPGTGKTSLGQSIAESLERKFVRISLGGVRDEAEIRGHRRTYLGALPGRILQTMRRAGTLNPLFMLDEIDKLSKDVRGDPASALLEVLDLEQNHAFSDHYLELPYDLSKIMFITTANSTASIPPALLDRMEIIEFPGYVEEEKVIISKRFLIPRQIEENGLQPGQLRFSDPAIQRIIREYTYEAGVRNLEREIGRVCRKIARLKAEKKRHLSHINPSSIERFLGPPQFFYLEAERQDEVGVATAIAWTENGGEIMPVEVLITEGKANLQITGQIGDVMQESAQAALTFIKSRSKKLNIPLEIYDQIDIHIHIPEGAIPKDGPSAGITICTALVSALTQRKVLHDIGFTGEITLRGRVIPVGGVREKVLAAHRAGIRTIILPKRNTKDLIDVPKKARKDLKIIAVEHMDQVLVIALEAETEKTNKYLSGRNNDPKEEEDSASKPFNPLRSRDSGDAQQITPGI